ncbi:uncharacterized protein EI90DRAFT_3018101 [Cantharellus anzutake]|uniref:uncharacterized protein n=1 Tax=Cantharellus anzutake TaxID=1750568 RepID=UPI001905437A|nr:uncharacterized protein EI90DRAFT_3018101 [Cantharellus anzutake]KAF8327609.1 hypothetical protein EI90DRAFT_3018101 [Cantharellus anzutake]
MAGLRDGGNSVGFIFFRKATEPPDSKSKTLGVGAKEGLRIWGVERGGLIAFGGRKRGGPLKGLGVLRHGVMVFTASTVILPKKGAGLRGVSIVGVRVMGVLIIPDVMGFVPGCCGHARVEIWQWCFCLEMVDRLAVQLGETWVFTAGWQVVMVFTMNYLHIVVTALKIPSTVAEGDVSWLSSRREATTRAATSTFTWGS